MSKAETRAPAAKPPRRRHQEILEAAARVFHEKGYESTSIQDIAAAVGILKGSLYYYISSKEDLLYEILRRVHNDALGTLELVEAMEGNALQKIRAFATAHLTFNVENLVAMGVFFQDFRSLGEERQRQIVEERDQYDQYLRNLIRRGQEEGVVCPDVDPKLMAFAVIGVLNWVYQWYKPGGERSLSAVAEEFADFIVGGLACDPATHRPGHRGQLGSLLPTNGSDPLRPR